MHSKEMSMEEDMVWKRVIPLGHWQHSAYTIRPLIHKSATGLPEGKQADSSPMSSSEVRDREGNHKCDSRQVDIHIQEWFIRNLVPRNLPQELYPGQSVEFSDAEVVRTLFARYWQLLPVKQHALLGGLTLPSLACFKRRDYEDDKNEQPECLRIHSQQERNYMLLSLGVKPEKPKAKDAMIVGQPLSSYFASETEAIEALGPFSYNQEVKMWLPQKLPNWMEYRSAKLNKFLAFLTEQKQLLEAQFPRIPESNEEEVIAQTFTLLSKFLELNYNTGDAGTYAEPTLRSCTRLSEVIGNLVDGDFKKEVLEKRVLFMDLGAGTGTFISALARSRNCDALGIEYCMIRARCALDMYIQANTTMVGRRPIKMAYVPRNIFCLESLRLPEKYTRLILYLGDEAFEVDLCQKIAELVKTTSVSEVLLISNKEGRHGARFSGFWESQGFGESKATTGWNKRGGGNESGKFRIYQFRPIRDPKVTLAPVDSSIDLALRMCGTGSKEGERIDYYRRIKEQLLRGTYPHPLFQAKPRRMSTCPVVLTCFSGNTMQVCYEQCIECKRRFNNNPKLVRKAKSQTGGMGLFAKKLIPKGVFLLEYEGKHVVHPNPMDGAYVMEIPGIGFVDARDSAGVHKYVNHGCRPNTQFQKWRDHTSETRVSIVTCREIQKDEEILVHYMGRIFRNCGCPHCAPERNSGFLNPDEAANDEAAKYPKRRMSRPTCPVSKKEALMSPHEGEGGPVAKKEASLPSRKRVLPLRQKKTDP